MFNVRGLKPRSAPSKVGYISDVVHDSNQLFIALTETWLCDHKDAEVHVDGYTLFRQDRKVQTKSRVGRDSGGVAVYVRDDIAVHSNIVVNFSNGVVEALAVHLNIINTVLIIVYRSPESAGTKKSGHSQLMPCLQKIKECLQNVSTPTPNIVVCGDMNLPNANWLLG